MPNSGWPWNALSNPPAGNPTKSGPVNDLIKRVKKKEVRKQGKPSQARGAFEEEEFEQLLEIMERFVDVEKRLFVSAIFRFQYSLIGRIDDTAKFKLDELKQNHQHTEFSILVKLCWSKNVNEERDAPDQISCLAQIIQNIVFSLDSRLGWNFGFLMVMAMIQILLLGYRV